MKLESGGKECIVWISARGFKRILSIYFYCLQFRFTLLSQEGEHSLDRNFDLVVAALRDMGFGSRSTRFPATSAATQDANESFIFEDE